MGKKYFKRKIKQMNWTLCILTVLIIFSYITSIVFLFYKSSVDSVIMDGDFYNALGVFCQIIATICLGVLSILQLSITLQDNYFLGVSVRSLYRMRKKQHLGFALNVLVSLGFIFLVAAWICERKFNNMCHCINFIDFILFLSYCC